jgi:cellulose synthase/poly-beta-1,6-N-acetylglucosamine synthase-like glycosyltransferase
LTEIVLGLITKNSHQNLGNTFIKALEGSLRVPYDNILMVDSGIDDTLEATSKFCHEKAKVLIELDGVGKNRARARQTVIDHFLNHFKERWLMFLDDDCILKPNFFKEAEKHMADSRVGLIWGLDDLEGTKFANFLRYSGLNPRDYSLNGFRTRGGTHDTLLRRKALEGIKIPSYLDVFEDRHIKNYVEKVGYKTAIVYEGCWHLNDYHIIKDALEYYKTYGNILAHRIVGNGL